jgi:hypothetical protein
LAGLEGGPGNAAQIGLTSTIIVCSSPIHGADFKLGHSLQALTGDELELRTEALTGDKVFAFVTAFALTGEPGVGTLSSSAGPFFLIF